ncbi:hypothetical protein EFB08_03110 [Rufibacter latericius]|uniref:Uncharacterized protein n=1 Tax=Rufibacter latericius TaxID=2487040 RepID=A0A3M9N2Y4_9BACT|nr:hypothetical protein EFB08_03110 [Rufibacter latericius]
MLVAVNAFGGGYYGMAGAENIPAQWLKGSPFQDYFIPSLILFVCVGGSALAVATPPFWHHWLARTSAFICGVILLLWISIQVAIIGFVSWLQPATTIAAFLILLF